MSQPMKGGCPPRPRLPEGGGLVESSGSEDGVVVGGQPSFWENLPLVATGRVLSLGKDPTGTGGRAGLV